MGRRRRIAVPLGVAFGLALVTACGTQTGEPQPTGSTAVRPTASATEENRRVVCEMHDRRLVEISGLASSIHHPDLLWTHNDSGDGARVFGVDSRTCEVRAVVTLTGITVVDAEAIAMGRDGDGQPVIWLGDIGNNGRKRTSVALYRFPEPAYLGEITAAARTYTVKYPGDPFDAEGLMVEPSPAGRIYLVSKRQAEAGIYVLPADFAERGSGTATRIGDAPWLPTDAAYAPNGEKFVLRNYLSAWSFEAPPPGREIASMVLPVQPQGEAITFSADSESLFIASERRKELIQVPVPE